MQYKNLDAYRNLPSPLVVSFSGGRSSGYQLAHIMAANDKLPVNVEVCFENTGLEMPETLNYVRDCERHFGVKITWLEYDSTAPHLFRIVNHNSASRKGEPFRDLFTQIVKKRKDGTAGPRPLPYPARRVCTGELKTKTMHRYLRTLEWRNYYNVLGFRHDEPKRVERRRKSDERKEWGVIHEGGYGIFPMYEAGADIDDVMAFWDAAPFDLQIDSWEGNCDMCFMKSTLNIKRMMQKYPERVPFWLEMEAHPRPGRNSIFRKDRPRLSELWEQAQRGDMSAGKGTEMICGTCSEF